MNRSQVVATNLGQEQAWHFSQLNWVLLVALGLCIEFWVVLGTAIHYFVR